MGKAWTNVWTYIGIVFLFFLFFNLVVGFGGFLQDQHNAGRLNLSIDQQEYILIIQGIDMYNLNATNVDVADPISYQFNASAGTPKDFAIEFLFAQEKSITMRERLQLIYSIPTITLDILKIPRTEFTWLINSIFWFFFAGIFVATIYFVRAVVTRD